MLSLLPYYLMDWYLIMLNDKQEKFAQAYVLHRNATEAARAAGYAKASAYNQGYRLLQSDEITERIKDLEQELETNVNGHTNSAIKALELLSRVRGANSDVNINLDEETLEGAIVGCLNVLGEEKVLDLLSKCDFTIYEDEEENGEPESVTEEGVEESLDIPQPEEATSPV